MSQDLWAAFVHAGVGTSTALEQGLAGIGIGAVDQPEARPRLHALAGDAFGLALQSLLLGAEDIGRLALACERCLDLLALGQVPVAYGYPLLASSLDTLRQAFAALAAPDRSGARVDPLPLRAARYELETLFPVPGASPRPVIEAPDVPLGALVRRRDPADAAGPAPARAAPASAPPGPPDAAIWVPRVDEDMIELFFEEADERIEDLATKLLALEQQPGDIDIVREVFRDLHTLKGSSAMVGLEPLNQLAHAAEDLVGHIRDGARQVDGAIIDALLATLDGLRDIAVLARGRKALDVDLTPILDRLREPHSTPPLLPDPVAGDAGDQAADAGPARAPAAVSGPQAGPAADRGARQTIRVDFDKLDRLLNLVGELVLGREGLRSAIHSLTVVSGELPESRPARSRAARSARPRAGRDGSRDATRLAHMQGELGRVERVLVDIAQELDSATGRLDSVSTELREQVMKLRMVPVRGVFRKHQRTVRDLAGGLGKRVRMELAGEDTELDKLLVEALDEPLLHLVRNAVDHGIEAPEARAAAGKPAEGSIRLSAAHQGNQVIIRIEDDGRGMDPEALRARARARGLLTEAELADLDDRQALELIFRPGFSTAATVSAVSGRGVGMDVVKQIIVTQLKGSIDIDAAPGRGTAFTLRLPLTLAIIQVLLARAGGEVLAVPLDAVVRTLACDPAQIQRVQDREVLQVEGRHVPLVRLDQVLVLDAVPYDPHDAVKVILTEVGGERFGLVCAHLLGKKEIVIKSLGPLLQHVPCAAGATLLGDRCVIILDVPAVVQRALRRPAAGVRPAQAGPDAPGEPDARPAPDAGSAPPLPGAPHVLLAEDSDTVRESLRRMLVAAGYRVTAVRDGAEALDCADRHTFDLVSTDVMMPHMDGYELTRALRDRPAYRDTPIVMVTSRGERIDRVRGFDAGVDEYITKPHDRSELLGAIARLLAARRA